MAKTHLYQAHLVWSGASQGPTKSYLSYSREFTAAIAGKAPFKMSADPQFKGDPGLLNPEDLLLASLSVCHALTYLAYAARKNLLVLAYEDRAEGTLTLDGGAAQFTDVLLRPVVTVARGSDMALVEALHEPAHRDCFIARSVNFPVRHAGEAREADA